MPHRWPDNGPQMTDDPTANSMLFEIVREVRDDLKGLRGDVRDDINDLRNGVKKDISDLRKEINEDHDDKIRALTDQYRELAARTSSIEKFQYKQSGAVGLAAAVLAIIGDRLIG